MHVIDTAPWTGWPRIAVSFLQSLIFLTTITVVALGAASSALIERHRLTPCSPGLCSPSCAASEVFSHQNRNLLQCECQLAALLRWEAVGAYQPRTVHRQSYACGSERRRVEGEEPDENRAAVSGARDIKAARIKAEERSLEKTRHCIPSRLIASTSNAFTFCISRPKTVGINPRLTCLLRTTTMGADQGPDCQSMHQLREEVVSEKDNEV